MQKSIEILKKEILDTIKEKLNCTITSTVTPLFYGKFTFEILIQEGKGKVLSIDDNDGLRETVKI